MFSNLLILSLALGASVESTDLVGCAAKDTPFSLAVDSQLRSGSTAVVQVKGSGSNWVVELADGYTVITKEGAVDSGGAWRVSPDGGVAREQERVLEIHSNSADLDLACASKDVRLDRKRLEALAAATRALPAPVAVARRAAKEGHPEATLSVRPGLAAGTAVVSAGAGAELALVFVVERKAKSPGGDWQLTGRGSACYASAGHHCTPAKTLVLGAKGVAAADLGETFAEELAGWRVDNAALEKALAQVPAR